MREEKKDHAKQTHNWKHAIIMKNTKKYSNHETRSRLIIIFIIIAIIITIFTIIITL